MGFIQELFSDPKGMLLVLLLALPGRLLAIAAHESAHGWVADRCGDPTARLMGRFTLNPLKHFDLVGTLCMVLFGFGWAKPVPVNPLNFRHYRKDDLKVSLAGVTMTLTLFFGGCIVMYGMLWLALKQLPYQSSLRSTGALFRTTVDGVPALCDAQYWYDIADCLRYPWGLWDVLIAPVFGKAVGYLYQMLYYFVSVNLVLAVFNLIPIPPLDGYHVLNDLVLKRPLFADRKAQGAGMAIMLVAMYTGVLSKALNVVYDFVLSGVGGAMMSLFRATGLF